MTRDNEAAANRQLPQANEVFLDHVGYFAEDLTEAGAALERLGFQVSQVNVQTNDDGSGRLTPSGTSNRLARLRLGYLEILAPTHDTPLATQARAGLSRYAGLHLVALSHDDVPRQRARLVDAGFAMQEVVHLRRHDVTLAGAPEVAWSVLRCQPGVMAEGRIQFTKSHNPEHVWRPERTAHANAADALGDVLICVADRAEALVRYGRYTGRAPMTAHDMGAIALDRGRLVFIEPAAGARAVPQFHVPSLPFIAGVAIRSADIARTHAALDARSVTPVYADHHLLCIHPRDALGASMLFYGRDVRDPWGALATRSD